MTSNKEDRFYKEGNFLTQIYEIADKKTAYTLTPQMIFIL